MILTINGERRELTEVGSVSEMLAAFRLENKILVVELNRVIVERSDYANTALKDGDQVEIVHFVGGG